MRLDVNIDGCPFGVEGSYMMSIYSRMKGQVKAGRTGNNIYSPLLEVQSCHPIFDLILKASYFVHQDIQKQSKCSELLTIKSNNNAYMIS